MTKRAGNAFLTTCEGAPCDSIEIEFEVIIWPKRLAIDAPFDIWSWWSKTIIRTLLIGHVYDMCQFVLCTNYLHTVSSVRVSRDRNPTQYLDIALGSGHVTRVRSSRCAIWSARSTNWYVSDTWPINRVLMIVLDHQDQILNRASMADRFGHMMTPDSHFMWS